MTAKYVASLVLVGVISGTASGLLVNYHQDNQDRIRRDLLDEVALEKYPGCDLYPAEDIRSVQMAYALGSLVAGCLNKSYADAQKDAASNE